MPNDETQYVCADCNAQMTEDELLPLKDIEQRVLPGEPMPDGECPHCHAVCHELDEDETHVSQTLRDLINQALHYEAHEFDGPEDEDLDVNGADLVDFFSQWRLDVKAALEREQSKNVIAVDLTPAKDPQFPCCKNCYSRNITRDGTAVWDESAQGEVGENPGEWVLAGVFDAVTCEDCGYETKMGEHWATETERLELEKKKKAKREQFNKAISPMGNAGKPWDKEQDDKLRQLFGENNDADYIALSMGRTCAGIIARCERLGLIERKPVTR